MLQSRIHDIVPRTFSKVGPVTEEISLSSNTLKSYYDCSAIIVLGDPGLGKTTSFKEAAKHESNSFYMTVRDFITFPVDSLKGKILYLDGLDEERSKTLYGSGALDEIRKRLFALGMPKFRLSCRSPDWYGSIDQENLKTISKDERVEVLRLDSLSENDILAIAEGYVQNPKRFLKEAKQKGVFDLLTNPQTLKMMLQVVKSGYWPETRIDIFKKACEIMAREFNDEHARSLPGRTNINDILYAAGALCSYYLLASTKGFSLTSFAANNDFPWIGSLPEKTDLLEITSKKRLFTFGFSKADFFTPIHRTIAEYLSALYLRTLIKKGLPLRRVLALITGHDGGTLSDLRGLFAWFACVYPEYSDVLVPRDPLGIILYGDVSTLNESTKKNLLFELGKLAERDPWFRSEDWNPSPFGALCSPDFVKTLLNILKDETQPEIITLCILDAISHGPKLLDLGDVLLEIIRDKNKNQGIRRRSLIAFCNACPHRKADLRGLLDEINNGNIDDKNDQLRGGLLNELYPEYVSTDQIMRYLIPSPEDYIGQYYSFISQKLPQETSNDDVPVLLDHLAINKLPISWSRSRVRNRFIGRLLIRGLELYGEKISPKRLYDWIGCSRTEKRDSLLEREQEVEIKKWLEDHPAVIEILYQHFLKSVRVDKFSWEDHCFWVRLYYAKPPKGFIPWLLELATKEKGDLAVSLFEKALSLCYQDGREDILSLDDFEAYVKANPKFRETYRKMTVHKIEEWRLEDAEREIKNQKKNEKWRKQQTVQLSKRLNQIVSGKAIHELSFLAKIYFAQYSDVNEELPENKRIASTLSSDFTDSAKEGFVAILNNPELPSSEEIGKLRCRRRQYKCAIPVLAGMKILADQDEGAIFEFSNRILKSALVFHFDTFLDHKSKWPNEIISNKPNLAIEALIEYWRPMFEKRIEHIPGLYELRDEEYMVSITEVLSFKLLESFPNCRYSHLEIVLLSAISHANRTALLSLAQNQLNDLRKIHKDNRIMWMGTAFFLNPESWQQRLIKYLNGSADKLWGFLHFIEKVLEIDDQLVKELPTETIPNLIKLLGSQFNPHDMPVGSNSIVFRFWDASKMVSNFIEWLSDRIEPEIQALLTSLLKESKLQKWHSFIAHNLELHIRKQREHAFRYPSLQQIINTLTSGEPSSINDLHAISCDSIKQIAEDILYGPTDQYKIFWNVDPHGRPTKPRPENDARNRILERLRDKLRPLGVDAEKEGNYAREKRADIKVLFKQMNIPIEIKRHYHPDVWSALNEQLIKKYTIDPGAQGWGIYLVLWFGKEIKKIPKPPNGISKTESLNELKEALMNMIPSEVYNQIEIICIDCSSPKA